MRHVRTYAKPSTTRDGTQELEVVFAGDFNRHDQLWGGDDVSLERQGEADPIIDLMNEFALSSLLPRGTKTWHGGEQATTIDLVLTSEEVTNTALKCTIHQTEHGSDHRAIETIIDLAVPTPKQQERLLLRNAPWKEINARIANVLLAVPLRGAVQHMTDRLMAAVQGTVHALTPKARPMPYSK